MEIIIDNRIKEIYTIKDKIRTADNVNEIVIHGTAGYMDSTIEGLIKWIIAGGFIGVKNGIKQYRHERYLQGIGLFHFVISQNGIIYQLYDPYVQWMYHSSSGKHDKKTIGIELENYDHKNNGEYSVKQYGALLWLIFEHLMISIPGINTIAGHSKNSDIYSGRYQDDPQCPGVNFRWDIIKDELLSRGKTYTWNEERISEIC